MSVSKKVRFEVFKRDLFTCQYCGKRPPDVVLEVDHVHPRCDGGSDDMDNLTTSCWDCNRGKAGNGLGNVAPAVDEMARLAAIQEMAERSKLLLQEQRASRSHEEAMSETITQVIDWWDGETGEEAAFQEPSVRMFIKRGLRLSDFRDAIDSTVLKQGQRRMRGEALWRYFCGACWAMIRDREGTE